MESQNTTPPAGAPQPQLGPAKNTVMAVLAYLGILVIISYVFAKDDPFVKFHIKQGLVLVVIEIAVWLVGYMIYSLWPLLQLVNLAILVFIIIGIINAVRGHEKPLPVLGQFAKHFPI